MANLTPDVKQLRLQSPVFAQGAPAPGSHVVLMLAPGLLRSYSIFDAVGDGFASIAVRRADPSRGGSAYVYEMLQIGATLGISAPRDGFPLHPLRTPILIAAGIGITPIFAIHQHLCRETRPHVLHTVCREGEGALMDRLDPGAEIHRHVSIGREAAMAAIRASLTDWIGQDAQKCMSAVRRASCRPSGR